MTNEFSAQAALAQKEYNLIQDLLRTPLREDLSGKALPGHRVWRGGCLETIARPDLIPIGSNPSEPDNFCIIETIKDIKHLKIAVKNQGNFGVDDSLTRLEFSTDNHVNIEIVDQRTGQIRPGEKVDLTVKIPSSYQELNFNLKINVNFDRSIDESDVANNIKEVFCGAEDWLRSDPTKI
jgi:hypothetical protein